MKRLDLIKSQYLSVLIRALNAAKVQKDDLVGIYPPSSKEEEYTAVFYRE